MRTTVLFLASLAVCGCSGKPPCEDKVGAFVMAQDFVKKRLSSPSTADFPYITADGVHSVPTTLPDGRCAFHVRIYVDAQNVFGATVRENFSVTVAPDLNNKGSWDLIEISQ